MAIKYEIECIREERYDRVSGDNYYVWMYRVVLLVGRTRYKGESRYARHNDAKKAALRAIEALIP